MTKKLTLPILALLSVVRANDSSFKSAHSSRDPAIERIKQNVDYIYEKKMLSSMTFPDYIDENWDNFQDELEKEVENRMEIAGDKLHDTL